MMQIALTGGIGSGKSTVLAMFSNLGIPTFSADDAAKFALQNDIEIQRKIISLLGPKAYVNNLPNRSYIAERVFTNKQKLLALNDIVHPAAKLAYTNWHKDQKAVYTMYEFPLVFELDAADQFDAVVLVFSSVDERILRVQKRDNTTKDAVLARMENQWTDEQKIPLANFVIDNNSIKETKAQVLKFHDQISALPKK